MTRKIANTGIRRNALWPPLLPIAIGAFGWYITMKRVYKGEALPSMGRHAQTSIGEIVFVSVGGALMVYALWFVLKRRRVLRRCGDRAYWSLLVAFRMLACIGCLLAPAGLAN